MGHDPPGLGHAQLFQGIEATEMNQIDRRLGHLGNGQGPVRAFRLQAGGAGQGMVFGFGMAFRQRRLDQFVDDDAVFRMHADQGAVLARLAHGPKDGAVVRQQDAGIGHE